MTKHALSVKDILAVMYNEGLFAAVKESLDDMNWWEWSKAVAQISATVALWVVPGAGQAAFLVQISLALMDAWDIVAGLREMKNYWGQNHGGGGKKWRRRKSGQKGSKNPVSY